MEQQIHSHLLRPIHQYLHHYQDLQTSVYSVEEVATTETQLIIKMFVPKTACKPALQVLQKGKEALSCCSPVESVEVKGKKVVSCC